MSRTLATVKRAATQRARAATAYRAAILQARADGHTFTAIGEAAGITKQSARRILERNETPKEG